MFELRLFFFSGPICMDLCSFCVYSVLQAEASGYKNFNQTVCMDNTIIQFDADKSKFIAFPYTEVTPYDTVGPNPGNVFGAWSVNGVSFTPLNNGSALYPQRGIDVKYDRLYALHVCVF